MLPSRFLLFVNRLMVILVLAVGGQAARAAPPTLNDSADVEAYFDSFFNRQMANSHISGLVFTLVSRGKVIMAKGYGYADLVLRVMRLGVGCQATLNLTFQAGLCAFCAHTEFFDFLYGIPLPLRLLCLWPPVSALLSLFLTIGLASAWWQGTLSIAQRITYSLYLLVNVWFMAILFSLNLWPVSV